MDRVMDIVMRAAFFLKLALAIAFWIVFLRSCADLAATTPESHQVSVELLADRAAVSPGETLTLGVLFRVKTGWHIYWKNPGDAGLPTSVRFLVPEGWDADRLRWPVPVRFDQPGGIVGYGYADSVLLSARVTVPGRLPSGPTVTIGADVTWLCCEKVCIPGRAHAELQMPVVRSGGTANRALFTAWERQLPIDAETATGPFVVKVRGNIPVDGASGTFVAVLHWQVPPVRVEWFPTSITGLKVETVSLTTEGNQTHLTFTVRILPGQKLSVDRLDTLVVYTDTTGERRGVNVPVRLR
jgi:DsbC/DsbD-like thiol-disulfide interchange protein